MKRNKKLGKFVSKNSDSVDAPRPRHAKVVQHMVSAPMHFTCPHCGGGIEVLRSQINCAIFRHGIFCSNGAQINQHLEKKICDCLTDGGKIYGCGRPFKIYPDIDSPCGWRIIKCDYI